MSPHGRIDLPKSAAPSPRISVVITVFNRTAYLREAIRSVLGQDLGEAVEILVVDDGSAQPVETAFRAEFPSVRWVRQANEGVCAARQRGADLACGEVVAFLDDDDVWHPSKLRLQLQLLRARPDLSAVGCDLADPGALGGGTAGFLRQRGFTTEAHAEQVPGVEDGYVVNLADMVGFMLRVLPMMPSSLVFQKAALREAGGWNRAVRGVGDVQDVLLRTARRRPIGYIDRPLLGLRRGHGQHMTRDRYPQLFQQARVMCRLYDGYPQDLRGVVRGPLLTLLDRTAHLLAQNGRPADSARLLLAAMRRGSLAPRTALNAARYAARAWSGVARRRRTRDS